MGRSAGLRIGRVVEVKARKKTYTNDTGYGIVVQGVDDDWDFHGLRLNERKGTLLFGDRIIVLSPDKVPDRYRKLLE